MIARLAIFWHCLVLIWVLQEVHKREPSLDPVCALDPPSAYRSDLPEWGGTRCTSCWPTVRWTPLA